MSTLESIAAIAAEQFGADAECIDLDAPIQQLGADSLGYLEFIFELEGRFNITIDQEEVKQVRTLRDLGTTIDRMMTDQSEQRE